MRALTKRLHGYDFVNVWQEFSGLAMKHGAVNLGQGFPDWPTPDFVKDEMVNAVTGGNFNQYCRPPGDLKLTRSLAKVYTPLFGLGRDIDPETEVTVTVGATEALYSCMMAFVEEGDEVIMLEPAFDIYAPQVQMAGGESVYVTLKPPPKGTGGNWSLDMSELEAAITPRTRVILLNTPHNPTGWVMPENQAHELKAILDRHEQVLCITDEVYDRLVFPPIKHTRLGSLPGMWDRVLTVGSAGKTFSVTGWKIGWVLGAASLVKSVMLCNQWVQFSVSTPAQVAVGGSMERALAPYEQSESYYAHINSMYQDKLTRLGDIFKKYGITPLHCQSTYYLLLDISAIEVPDEYKTDGSGKCVSPDYAFARWLVEKVKICVIPCSAFYTPSKKHTASHLVRIACCKTDETIAETERRLAAALPRINA